MNKQDPSNPTENCYNDVEFSVADGEIFPNFIRVQNLGVLKKSKYSLGKFWSAEACFAERNTPKGLLSFRLRINYSIQVFSSFFCLLDRKKMIKIPSECLSVTGKSCVFPFSYQVNVVVTKP